jgi:NAD(P)-dependent dehydrogenase (short-subunit alcohol dehydrogenase family)
MRITTELLLVLVAVAALSSVGQAQSPPATALKAVLVTGASSGIGRKITERLAAHGYLVYAGARKDEDIKALGAIKNVQPVRLDVTRTRDIDAAVATITRGGRGLYGLVNNAGVATAGTLADMKLEEFELLMAVNVTGPVRITKAFEPLIIAAKGRITNIGSVWGVDASADLPAYAMSKHAMEAFTDSLAKDLGPRGVHVSIVEPGHYDSDIQKNFARRTGGDPKDADRSMYPPPDDVAVAVEDALFGSTPKRRYMVIPDEESAERTIRKQMERVVQLNEGQRYTYDRATLVKMLDDALVGSRPRSR